MQVANSAAPDIAEELEFLVDSGARRWASVSTRSSASFSPYR